ncbi:hypothetical protein G6F31_020418 [Rhizopus arrhizus]|uniref:Uncharacterized protein n=1 Tax=Rhizopus delemar TaxID=936053 RepID=A0A9P6XN56_9FUNG|nr:hypothetical protein G6F31_020418 [Rhizopus arrhizus]KAG1529125.1 hypothetical protein G6F50_018198 [Rhizopus delemar]
MHLSDDRPVGARMRISADADFVDIGSVTYCNADVRHAAATSPRPTPRARIRSDRSRALRCAYDGPRRFAASAGRCARPSAPRSARHPRPHRN